MKVRWLGLLGLLSFQSLSIMTAQISHPGDPAPRHVGRLTEPRIEGPELPARAVPIPTTSIKLFDDSLGWVASKHRIFQTSDAGSTWRDITPADPHHHEFAPNSDSFTSVFFLGPQIGWALLTYQTGDNGDHCA